MSNGIDASIDREERDNWEPHPSKPEKIDPKVDGYGANDQRHYGTPGYTGYNGRYDITYDDRYPNIKVTGTAYQGWQVRAIASALDRLATTTTGKQILDKIASMTSAEIAEFEEKFSNTYGSFPELKNFKFDIVTKSYLFGN